MKGIRAVPMLIGATTLLLAAAAFAGGFNIYEAGARATALGGAFTATADDGSAIFYNPAGLAFLEGSALELNVMPIMPKSKFTGALNLDGSYATGETADQTFPIPGAFYTCNKGDFAWGLGVTAPFGLGVKWQDPDQWAGRRLSYDVQLKTFYATPTLSWKLEDNVSIGFGVDVGYTDITLKKRSAIEYGTDILNPYLDVMNAKIEGDSKLNVTPMAGVLVKATPDLSFGLMYHHEKKMAIRDGDLTLTNVAPAPLQATVDAQIAALGGAKHKGSADLKLPHILSLGMAYQLDPSTRIECDVVHFNWSTFDQLKLEFDVAALDQTLLEEYEDVWQIRAGVERRLTDGLRLLAGYVHDKSPQPVESMSPLLPDADRNDYSVGLQWQASDRITINGTYMGVDFKDRSNVVNGQLRSFDQEFNPAGTYASYASIFGFGVGYQF